MNFIKTTLLEKIILILMFCLFVIYITNHIYIKEGFENTTKNIIIKKGNDIFDNYYVNLYDDLLNNIEKNEYDIHIIKNNTNYTSNSKILDIGCGTGQHVNLFNKQSNNSVIGMDNSQAMIKKAKENFPNSTFKLSNILNSLEFHPDTFTHITCLNLTIYYIKNKQLLLNNCYNWLQPKGVLVLNLVDSNKFNAITSIAYDANQKPLNKNCDTRLTKCNISFTTLNYKSEFKLDKTINANTINFNEPNALLKESFTSKNSNSTRINEHQLYMSSQQSILNIAKYIGFIIKSEQKYSDIKYKANFIYILEKP
jgi:SAM-dependent methyltransferase